MTSCQVVASTTGFDTEVYVTTNDSLPDGSPDSGQAASARARASTDPFSQGSPSIKASVSSSCDASLVSGPVFSSHGGDVGFFPGDGTNYSYGCEPKLAGALDKLAEAQAIKLQGTAGYVPQSQTDAKDPAAVAHSCGDASTTTGIPSSVTNSELSKFGLVRPFKGHPEIVELTGVSCDEQSTTVDASSSGTVGLGISTSTSSPGGGGPVGTFSFFGGGGGISIGESPLQVGCQIYGVWQSLNLSRGIPQKLLLVALMAAQERVGENWGVRTSAPTAPTRTSRSASTSRSRPTAGHDPRGAQREHRRRDVLPWWPHRRPRASTEGLIDVWQAHPGDDNAGLAQDTQHSGAGLASHGGGQRRRARERRGGAADARPGHDRRLPEDMTVRRGMTIAWLARAAAALALAGCGAGAAAQTTPQVPTFPDLGYRYIPPQIPAGVAHGSALAVDLSNVGRMRPQAMRLASDTTLSDASWTGWGATSATGHGTVTVRVCTPSCGGGRDQHGQATVAFQPHQGLPLVPVLRERHRDP